MNKSTLLLSFFSTSRKFGMAAPEPLRPVYPFGSIDSLRLTQDLLNYPQGVIFILKKSEGCCDRRV